MAKQPNSDNAYPSTESVAQKSMGDSEEAGKSKGSNPVLDAIQTLALFVSSQRENGNPGAVETFKAFLESIKNGGGEGAKEEPAAMPAKEPQPPINKMSPEQPEEENVGEGEEEGSLSEESKMGAKGINTNRGGLRPEGMPPKGFRKETKVLK